MSGNRLARLLRWPRNLAAWFWEAPVGWLAAVLFLLGVPALVLIWGSSERVVRLTGLGLQVFGMVLVLDGIRRTRALFGRPSVFGSVAAYLRSFPLPKRKRISIQGTSASLSAAGGRMNARVSAVPGATLEQRVAALEQNAKLLDARASALETELDAEAKQRKAADEAEQAAREKTDRELRQLVEAQEVGGLQEATVGALCLLAGSILSTAAQEIACLIARLLA